MASLLYPRGSARSVRERRRFVVVKRIRLLTTDFNHTRRERVKRDLALRANADGAGVQAFT
jgi:hypothetical protein